MSALELLNAKNQTRLWGNEYSHSISDIRTLPREIVSAVTKALNLAGKDTTERTVFQHSTSNPDAYRLFLQGQMSYHKLTKEALHRSIALYRSALELDPNMGSAYAGIASAYSQMGNQNWIPWAQAADSARIAATRALSLNRNLADAHFALGCIRYDAYELITAEEEFKLALRLNPIYTDCIHIYAHLLSEDGRHDDGIRLMKQSVELEPLSAHYQYCLGSIFLWRRYDKAIQEYSKVFSLDSTFYSPYKQLSRCYAEMELYDKAFDFLHRYMQKCPDDHEGELYLLGKIYSSMAKRDEVGSCLRQLKQLSGKAPVDPGYIAGLYALLIEKDSAFVYLEKAYQEHSNQIYLVKNISDFDPLRDDSRYVELVQKMGFSK